MLQLLHGPEQMAKRSPGARQNLMLPRKRFYGLRRGAENYHFETGYGPAVCFFPLL